MYAQKSKVAKLLTLEAINQKAFIKPSELSPLF